MGTNAVRLLRTDHRRLGELAGRLGRPYRAGEELRLDAARQLRAHVDVTRAEVLPFALDRVAELSAERHLHQAALGRLADTADELEAADDPVPVELAQRLGRELREHVELEQPLLDRLQQSVAVPRLRVLGEAVRRRRDTLLRSQAGGASRLRRPVATRAELYERARRRGIEGRSGMTRAELQAALRGDQGR